jgi:hypothetical protein
MSDAFFAIIRSDSGCAVLGAVGLACWLAGVAFVLLLFWPRIRAARPHRIDAAGRCTCEELDFRAEHIRELYRQIDRMSDTAVKLMSDPAVLDAQDARDGWQEKGIGR